MGSMAASDMVAYDGVNDATLTWHLTSNHYPPLPIELLPVAKRVIRKANDEQWEANVRLPEGITYKGSTLAPVWACVEAWHLDAFIEVGGE